MAVLDKGSSGSEKPARLLPERARVVHKRHPFTITLKDRIAGELQPVRMKIDLASKSTAIGAGVVPGMNAKRCARLLGADRYTYNMEQRAGAPPRAKATGCSLPVGHR